MDAKDYQKIYQNINEKAPIESGVQTLVYMFLYEIMKHTYFQLIVIDRLNKKTQFVTPVGISDGAVVSDDFKFSENSKDGILSYVEVKGIGINLLNFEDQIKGQLLSCGKILCTNGNEWKYYDIEKYIEKYSENDIDHIWAKNDYDDVKNICYNIESTEKTLAIKKASYTHTKNDEYKKVYKDEIQELEQEKEKDRNELQNSLLGIAWLQNIM